MSERRVFLKQAGVLSAGLMLGPGHFFEKPDKRVGLQLYSLRDQIGKDVKGVIEKVAAAGYKQVETYGYTPAGKFWGVEPKDFSKLLKDNGLVSPSGHYTMTMFLRDGKEDDLKAFIDAAKIVGQDYITVPSGAASSSADAAKRAAEKLNQAGEICKKSGLAMGYHNHDAEFRPIDQGTTYDALLKYTDPALVKFQLDLFWAVRAGKDPIELFQQHPGRFVMWHVKDMDKANPRLNTEVGNGSIDFKKIFKNANLSGVKHVIMEQENYTAIDPYVSIAQSCAYIKNNLL